ncbi:endo-1,3;1,4-beta-D-glucanase-like [Argentina anserina]|uniref:endo-1,3;1,4-beta-D-glucanase-like n=1 Tax=Argentina anserina TaxID=57926 RepID=UPI00217679AA|nr:endo-1,3;1,4-beta-D-glucanase-like [Potentilla anserina]
MRPKRLLVLKDIRHVRPQCCSNPPTLNPTSGFGRVEKFGGLNSYLTGSPNSKLAVVLVCDIFGYEAPILRKLADKIAAAGFFAVVPDFFYADPYVPAADGSFDSLPAWLKVHGTEKGFEDVKVVIEALQNKGVSAVGAVGFCWGAKVVVELSKGDSVQAAVLAHPSFVTVDDIKAVKVPISILGAEIDRMSSPEVVNQFEEALAYKKEIKSHVKIFPKVSHGWTVRYDASNEEAVKPAEEAHKDMLEWFANYVK